MKFQPFEKSIFEIQSAMEQNQITSFELTKYYLERIEKFDKKGPKLNAIVAINDDALKRAEEMDSERKAKGKRGDLHGIPIVIKDNFDTFDMPTTASSILLADNRPNKDAFILKKLRDAGAIILAKSNLSEFACHGYTDGTLMGQTLNPYDLSRTPGGSSGGTGVAISGNYAVCGLGTDTVNSVRSPASATSLVGFRPSTGLLSRSGIMPVSDTQDTAGTLTRCVTDAAVMLDVCAGFDPNDMITAEQVSNIPMSYTNHLKADGLRGKRLGLITNLMGNDKEVNGTIESSIRLMRENGAEIIPIEIQEFDMSRMSQECDVQYFEFKKQMDAYFDNATNCPIPNFKFLADSDKLYTGVSKFFKECAEVVEPENSELYKMKLLNNYNNRKLAYYIMAMHNLDAFVYPHQTILVQHVALKRQQGRNGLLASTIGFPAVTVPSGYSVKTEEAPNGVPIGIEFMARRWGEPILFEIAYSFEQLSKCRKAPPFCDDVD